MYLKRIVKIVYGLILFFLFFIGIIFLLENYYEITLPFYTSRANEKPQLQVLRKLGIRENSYELESHTIESPHFTEMTSFSIDAPSNWELKKVSEWPEQDGGGNNTGYSCTGFSLKRDDGKGVLFITPVCGWTEEIPGDCPPDTVLVSNSENYSIVRIYDPEKGSHRYELSYEMSLPDGEYINKQKPGVVCVSGIPTNGDVGWVYYEARLFCDEEEKDELLTIIDNIVISGVK